MVYSLKNRSGAQINSDFSDFEADGFVIDEEIRKEAFLNPQTIILRDSNETETQDFGGALKTITLKFGMVKATSGLPSAQQSFIRDFEDKLVNGNQSVSNNYPYQYTGGAGRTVYVKILDHTWIKARGDPRIVLCTIRMVESASGV